MSYLVAFDLADDLQCGGCPTCRTMGRVGEGSLRTLLAADITDQHVREHVLAMVDIATQVGGQTGMAVVAEWLLEVAGRELGAGRAAPSARRV